MTWNGVRHLVRNWKLAVHLLLGTRRFGVNNEWWSRFDSMFGAPLRELTIEKIFENYQKMKFRAKIGFVNQKTYSELFRV